MHIWRVLVRADGQERWLGLVTKAAERMEVFEQVNRWAAFIGKHVEVFHVNYGGEVWGFFPHASWRQDPYHTYYWEAPR